MQDLSTLLAKHINAAGLSVSASQQQQLLLFVELLDKWNKTYNLTSVRDPKDMLVKHIMDSLCVGPYLQGNNFIDVGTGPGLPGIPLAILYPERQFTLLDSLGKRIRFIRQVVFQLKLTNVEPVQARVEDFSPPQPFDAVLSRAFASLQDMVSWCQHLIDQHGRFYALKGLYPEQEIDNLPVTISFVSSQQIQVPELTGERHLIELTKNN